MLGEMWSALEWCWFIHRWPQNLTSAGVEAGISSCGQSCWLWLQSNLVAAWLWLKLVAWLWSKLLVASVRVLC